jgi:hypothetical protein
MQMNQAACLPSDLACPKFNARCHTDRSQRKKVSQADKLVLLCLQREPELFHDQHDTPYAHAGQSSNKAIIPIKSRLFKSWIASLMWEEEEKAPSNDALYSAINVLQAKAIYSGDQYSLYNRVAPDDDGFWIDMSNDEWNAIHVTAKGWEIVDDPPILFKRYSHQQPAVTPVPGGDPWCFLDFVNIDPQDEATRLLLLCAVISYLIPHIPHVILVLHGIQGSGKSTLFKLIKALIDPSSVDVLSMSRNERERVQQLDHHWCAFYDNITSLPTWINDSLCRAATGGGFTKRELYTDDEDIIYNFKRCVGLNGINIATQRGDLLDRSLLVGLHDIPKDKRKTEEQLLTEFAQCKGEILGGILDILVKALRYYPKIKQTKLYRMADFTRWGCAISVALGKTEQDFINAYESKVKAQIKEAALASPVATVLLDYMEHNQLWDGTPSQLFAYLNEHAKNMGISTRQKTWPKGPHILVRRLNELIPSLKALGLEVQTGLRSGKKRRIYLQSVSSVTSDTTLSKHDGSDATHANSNTSSASPKNHPVDNRRERQPCASCQTVPDHLYPDTTGIFLICERCKSGTKKNS